MNPRIARAFALCDLTDNRPTQCPRDTDPVEWCQVLTRIASDMDWDLSIYIDVDTHAWTAKRVPDRSLDRDLTEGREL